MRQTRQCEFVDFGVTAVQLSVHQASQVVVPQNPSGALTNLPLVFPLLLSMDGFRLIVERFFLSCFQGADHSPKP